MKRSPSTLLEQLQVMIIAVYYKCLMLLQNSNLFKIQKNEHLMYLPPLFSHKPWNNNFHLHKRDNSKNASSQSPNWWPTRQKMMDWKFINITFIILSYYALTKRCWLINISVNQHFHFSYRTLDHNIIQSLEKGKQKGWVEQKKEACRRNACQLWLSTRKVALTGKKAGQSYTKEN